jgi:hypothetical protein
MKLVRKTFFHYGAFAAAFVLMLAHSVTAQTEDASELAKKLANPVASLVSVPFQYNYDENYGPDDKGSVSRLNIQPVIPFSMNEEWNIITRTIIPLVDQKDIPLNGMSKSGLSDTVASQFLSPKAPTSRGWIWGVGIVELLPTASDEIIGGEKWGIGPTAVCLKQSGPWTVGALTNHIWSVAGDDDRSDVNATFIQPFLSYITKTKTTLSFTTESTYDWESEQWAVPVIVSIAQMLKVGPQILQVQVGARYWAESPDNGPEGWGARATLTLLFPK